MIYRKLGDSGGKVSAISMGCAGLFGNDYPPSSGKLSDQESYDLIDYAVDVGVDLFETAVAYGNVDPVANCVPLSCGLIVKYRKCERPEAVKHAMSIPMAHNFLDPECRAASIYNLEETSFFGCKEVVRLNLIEFPHNILDHACYDETDWSYLGIGTIGRSILLRGKLASMAEEAIRWALFSGVDTCLLGFKSKREIDFALECLEKGPIEWEEIIDPRRWK